ncbi:putative 11-beta-hydroxysteroid dehydrogenase [Helianthus anomalus]
MDIPLETKLFLHVSDLITYEYAKLGAYLAIIARNKPESRLEQVAHRARELGSPDVLFIFADVSKVDECRMFVDETAKHFGRCVVGNT